MATIWEELKLIGDVWFLNAGLLTGAAITLIMIFLIERFARHKL